MPVDFIRVFVESFDFVFASFIEGDGEFAHEPAAKAEDFDVVFQNKGIFGAAVSGASHHLLNTFDTKESAFEFATAVGIVDETAIPPPAAEIKKKMMYDAVDEGCGEDFAYHWLVDDERN